MECILFPIYYLYCKSVGFYTILFFNGNSITYKSNSTPLESGMIWDIILYFITSKTFHISPIKPFILRYLMILMWWISQAKKCLSSSKMICQLSKSFWSQIQIMKRIRYETTLWIEECCWIWLSDYCDQKEIYHKQSFFYIGVVIYIMYAYIYFFKEIVHQ